MKHVLDERGVVPVLLVVLVLALVAVIGVAVLNASGTRKDASVTTGNTVASAAPTANLKTYANTDAGFSFRYPSSYGDVVVSKEVSSYTGGLRYTGTFSAKPGMKFVLTSANYRDDGTNLLNTFRGWYESSGKTFYKWADTQYTGASPVEISSTLASLSVGSQRVLFVDDNSFTHRDGPAVGPGGGNLAALVNLQGQTYPGLVLTTSDQLDQLKTIVSTLQLN
jgi:hypothetical protein